MLDDFNRERQEIERRITVEAEQLKERELPDASGIILHGREWHAGVVGIVASRISRKYHRPTIVLGSEGELAKGSGRSVNGINLVQVLEECDDLLESWGGHPLAVGVSVREENIPAFQNRFDELVGEAMKGELLEPEIEIAAWLELNEINEELLRDLDLLHPFGQGHREPCFALREIVFEDQPLIFKENHFRFRIIDGDGRWIYGVAWKMADRIPPVDQPVDIVVRAYWNFFNNRKLLQLELIDWRLSK